MSLCLFYENAFVPEPLAIPTKCTFFFTPFCCVFFLDSRLTYRREGFPGLLKGHQPYHRVWISIWIYEPRSKARHIPGGVYGAIRYIILSLDADKWNARWRAPNNALVPRRSGPHSMPRCICQGFRPTVVMLCERSSSVTKHQIKKKMTECSERCEHNEPHRRKKEK